MNSGSSNRSRRPKNNVKRQLAMDKAQTFVNSSPLQPGRLNQCKQRANNYHGYSTKKVYRPNLNTQGTHDRDVKVTKISSAIKRNDSEKTPSVSRHDKMTSSATLWLMEPTLEEKRKLIIKTKLLTLSEPSFSQYEEQHINERAEAYALTTPPDSNYYILPENVDNNPSSIQSMVGKGKQSSSFSDVERLKERYKRKRRSYSNIDCFVTQTKRDDAFGDQHCLPAGTKLIKPPKKLVKLVAEAVDKSPDGLLQVQQIYTVLQNKFPYFRYMDKLAIGSWRSSIRHALYQKWFRKIRFTTESISTKGCFWAINQTLNPSEWIVPCNPEAVSLKNPMPRSSTPFLDLLQEPNVEEEEHLKDVIQIAKEYGISFPDCVAEAKGEFQTLTKLNIPSPVRDPDPILVACVPDYSIRTPKVKHGHFDVDEGFEELPFKQTPVKVTPLKYSPRSGSLSFSDTASPGADSLLTWTSPSFEELPNLFSPTYNIHPYGMPVFPDHQNSQN